MTVMDFERLPWVPSIVPHPKVKNPKFSRIRHVERSVTHTVRANNYTNRSVCKRFANDFHPWPRQPGKSLAKLLTRIQKSLFTVSHKWSYISLTSWLCWNSVTPLGVISPAYSLFHVSWIIIMYIVYTCNLIDFNKILVDSYHKGQVIQTLIFVLACQICWTPWRPCVLWYLPGPFYKKIC